MIRLNVLLLVAVMLSALALVRSQYETRRLVMAIEKVNKEAALLEVEHQRLLVERRAQATPQRVQTLAQQKLQMRVATPAITQYVSMPPAHTVVAPAGVAK
jgi:cell division protein FtsL